MGTPPSNNEQTPLPGRFTDRPVDRQTARFVGFIVALVILTWFHFAELDANWSAENVLLVSFACVLASWYSRPRSVLILVLIACLGWWLIDVRRDPDPWSCSARYLVRSILLLLLSTLTGRCRQSLDEAQRAARIDVLTGLPNRLAILEVLESELSRLQRFKRSFSIAMFDCDGFKSINDEQGHLAGDRALQAIAAAFRKQLRAYDCIGRFGGDEFILILPESQFDGVSKVIQRLKTASLAELPPEYRSLTFSVGVVTLDAPNDPQSSFPDSITCLHHADQAMYSAKRSGRDNTVALRIPPQG